MNNGRNVLPKYYIFQPEFEVIWFWFVSDIASLEGIRIMQVL